MNKIVLLGVAACFALANNSYAANKTHMTDALGAGNSRMDISFSTGNLKTTGKFLSAGTTVSMDGKITGYGIDALYAFGITDRLDIGIIFPLSQNTSVVLDYVIGANSYSATDKYEGQSDPSIGAQYLVLDKQQDRVSWNVYSKFSPAAAASDQGITEIKTNGSVTTAGTTSKSGNGYTTVSAGSTLSIPTGAGDIFLGAMYSDFGEKSTSGVKSKNGSRTDIEFGIESMLGDRTTLTPYVRYTMRSSGYNGTNNSPASSAFDIGLGLTNDVSKNLSVGILAEYNVLNERVVNYANGDKFSYTANGYTLNLTTMFFF